MDHLWNVFTALMSLGCVMYCALHLVLPHRILHPLKLTISCQEQGCKWKRTFNDRSEGDQLSEALKERMIKSHHDHFRQVHPEVDWNA